MSSTRTMSSSLERPMTISPSIGRGNSPPWYFPEMKRSAYDFADPLGGVWLDIGGSINVFGGAAEAAREEKATCSEVGGSRFPWRRSHQLVNERGNASAPISREAVTLRGCLSLSSRR